MLSFSGFESSLNDFLVDVCSVCVEVLSIEASVVESVGGLAVVVVVVVVVVVDLVGLNAFGLSSVIRISSGFVISLILMPNGLSFASCRFLSSFERSLPVVVVESDMTTSFLDVDLLASASFAANFVSSVMNGMFSTLVISQTLICIFEIRGKLT